MAVLHCVVPSRKCGVFYTVEIPITPSTQVITDSKCLTTRGIFSESSTEERRNLCKHMVTNYFNWSIMETSEISKTKCEKSLPFRKRLFHKYRREKNSSECTEASERPSGEDVSANINSQPSISTGRLPDEPHTSQSIKELEGSSIKGDLPLQPNFGEELSAEANFQKEFQNLHLLAEVTSDSRSEDPGEGSSIPLTVESLHTSNASNMKKHPLTCTYCRKKFHHKGDMNKHLRSHTKEQPYKCTYCSLKFSHTSNLQRHLRIHTGSKPHSCDCCKKKFSRIDKLHLHQRSGVCRKSE